MNDSHFQLVNSRVSWRRQELVLEADVLFPRLIVSRPDIIGNPTVKRKTFAGDKKMKSLFHSFEQIGENNLICMKNEAGQPMISSTEPSILFWVCNTFRLAS